jgi:1-deoxy-D-xylulose-5-phosphate synthase
MAAEGARPVVAIYSTFLQRSYDEIIHDVCLQNLPVVFAIDRAGIVGEDGPTHQGVFDISYLRHIPNLVVMAPRDALELKAMLAYAFTLDRPVAIRYPRGKAIELDAPGEIALGRAETMMEGTGLAVLSVGHMAAPALEACRRLADEGKAPTLINVRFVKPLDAELILGLTRSHGRIVTVEENAIQGGFGSAVSELMTTQRVKTHLTMIGLPDEFVEQGTQAELRRQYGLDADGLYAAFSKLLEG